MNKFLYLGLVVFSFGANAATLTAVCKDPSGRAIGIHGNLGGQKPINEPDAMTGGQVTIVWEVGQQKASLVIQGSGGGRPFTQDGFVVYRTDEQVSFLTTFPGAVWLLSFFTNPKRLLISEHSGGRAIDTGGAIAKGYEARCDVAVK